MKTKHIVAVLIMCLSVVFLGAIALAQPPNYELEKERGSWCDEMWFTIVTGCEARMVELLNHDVDAVGEPNFASYPTVITMDGIPSHYDVRTLGHAGYMMAFLGPFGCDSYFYAINNRVAPLDDRVFRTALAYCMDKSHIVDYPLADMWFNFVPIGQYWWYNLGVEGAFPKFNLQTAIDTLVGGGYTPVLIDGGLGAVPDNIDHWHMPGTTTNIRDLEQAVPLGNCVAMQMSARIESDLHRIGLPIYHTPLPLNYIVNQQWLAPPYLNWDLTVGIGFSLDDRSRSFLYEMFNGASIPNWNIWGIDDPDVNFWTDGLRTTLDWSVMNTCVFEAQEALLDAMPAIPLFISWKWTARTGPYDGEPGVVGWANMMANGGYNIWSAMFSRREELDGVPYPNNVWLSGQDAGVLNPLVSNTAYDWQLQSLVYSTLLQRHPYNGFMLPWCVTDNPLIELWNGTHTAAKDDPDFTDPTYDPSPVGSPGEVTGEKMTWTLRDDMTWHDGTPVTTADVEFCLDLLVNQNNQRYKVIQTLIHDVNVVSTYRFEVYYTGRYPWADADISTVALLAPKHVWEPYIDGPDNVLWNGDDEDHRFWDGSQWIDEYGYAAPEIETPSGTEQLTHLIGNGPFIYPYGGWTPGVSMRLVRWLGWHFTRILRGDNNFDGIADVLDLYAPVLAYGSQPGMPRWRFEADMANPAGLIDGRDIVVVYNDWGYYWYPSSTLPP